MSGVEIAVPVIAAVFALVSAFKDGGAIAEKLRVRRERRGKQLPNARLHKVLEQGAVDIQTSEREGVEDFGEAYHEDVATASKIKDVTIVLQDTIIKELAAAYQDDDMNDFTPAINSVIQARREAVNILNDHYLSLQKRRAQGLPLRNQQPRPVSPMFAARSTRAYTSDTIASDTSSSTRTQLHYHQRSDTLVSTDSADPGLETPQSPQPRTRSGIWGRFGRRTSVDTTANPMGAAGRQQKSQQTQSPPPSNVTSPEERRTNTNANIPNSPPGSLGLPSPALRRASTVASVFEPSQGGLEVTPISEDNKFAGLCKCAYRAQKYHLSKAMEPSMREYEWMYHCKKCKYRLTADSSQRGNPHFDDRIQTSVSTITFRFLFLWKSHVPTRDGQRKYSCLFCLLTGRPSKTYVGEDQLFGHIVRHANEVIVTAQGGVVPVQGMIEVHSDGISAANLESFDLYFPLDLLTPKNRLSFSMLPDSAIGNIDETASDAGTGIGLGLGGGSVMSRGGSRDGMHGGPLNTGLLSPLPITRPLHEVHGESTPHRMHSRSPTLIVTPEASRGSPFDDLHGNVWRQSATRYAELDATGQR